MKAVFFDAGNTLLHPYPSVAEVCRRVLSAHGHEFAAEDVERSLHYADEIYERHYRNDDTFWTSEDRAAELWSHMYASVLRELGVNGEADALGRAIYDEFGDSRWWRTYPDVVPGLERLHAAGLVLGMISNWDSRLPDLCHGLGISCHFDFVISSANLGVHKPDPRIFEVALQRAGVSADEACHVGDHYYADVLGARSAGLEPVLINRTGTGVSADCMVVTGVDELAETMERRLGI
ncbi:MAG: HAD family hydrolase [Actinobacteria bacterium]|nr:MAG: HAD family hydrolase [Actinomycetota bacterium]